MYQHDFFVVSTKDCRFCVSTAMAAFVERQLDATFPPRWVTFVDLTGSRIRLRSREIAAIMQSTAEQRELERMQLRGLHMEQDADRPPEAGV